MLGRGVNLWYTFNIEELNPFFPDALFDFFHIFPLHVPHRNCAVVVLVMLHIACVFPPSLHFSLLPFF